MEVRDDLESASDSSSKVGVGGDDDNDDPFIDAPQNANESVPCSEGDKEPEESQLASKGNLTDAIKDAVQWLKDSSLDCLIAGLLRSQKKWKGKGKAHGRWSTGVVEFEEEQQKKQREKKERQMRKEERKKILTWEREKQEYVAAKLKWASDKKKYKVKGQFAGVQPKLDMLPPAIPKPRVNAEVPDSSGSDDEADDEVRGVRIGHIILQETQMNHNLLHSMDIRSPELICPPMESLLAVWVNVLLCLITLTRSCCMIEIVDIQQFSKLVQECEKVIQQIDPNAKLWNFLKIHLLKHMARDIMEKGTTCNYNTKLNEKIHGLLIRSFEVCEFKDIEEHNISAMANLFSDCFVKGKDPWMEVDNLASKQGHDIVVVCQVKLHSAAVLMIASRLTAFPDKRFVTSELGKLGQTGSVVKEATFCSVDVNELKSLLEVWVQDSSCNFSNRHLWVGVHPLIVLLPAILVAALLLSQPLPLHLIIEHWHCLAHAL
ncbi:hypothetical protein ARMSODRAFT_968151 [Armillaria solidipes]|uniref:Uncharacterized protein n=1 Tax=Armillaria solidipes TaxID=1076256 RepID=A0A2H3CP29_9AGAR|nr:hypothetical protein ARMSODRAFT_968151 [Armillaria solidipes]